MTDLRIEIAQLPVYNKNKSLQKTVEEEGNAHGCKICDNKMSGMRSQSAH